MLFSSNRRIVLIGIAAIAVVCLACLAQAVPIKLAQDTPVHLVLSNTYVSGRAKVGDVVDYEVAEPVIGADGAVLIAKGAVGKGKITRSKCKTWLKNGQMEMTIEDVIAVDGTHLALKSAKGIRGRSSQIASWSVGPLGIGVGFKSNATAGKGARVAAYVAQDVTVDPSATFSTGQINPTDIDKLVELLRDQLDRSDAKSKEVMTGSVAVVPFELIGLKADSTAANVSEDFTTALISQGIKTVDRANLMKVLEELKLQDSGLVDTASAKSIGKLTGASALLLGSVSDRDSVLVINARIVSAESGGVLAADRVEAAKAKAVEQSDSTQPNAKEPANAKKPDDSSH